MSLPKEEMRRASTTLRHTGLLGAHPTSWDQSWTGEGVVCRGSRLKGVFHRLTWVLTLPLHPLTV